MENLIQPGHKYKNSNNDVFEINKVSKAANVLIAVNKTTGNPIRFEWYSQTGIYTNKHGGFYTDLGYKITDEEFEDWKKAKDYAEKFDKARTPEQTTTLLIERWNDNIATAEKLLAQNLTGFGVYWSDNLLSVEINKQTGAVQASYAVDIQCFSSYQCSIFVRTVKNGGGKGDSPVMVERNHYYRLRLQEAKDMIEFLSVKLDKQVEKEN